MSKQGADVGPVDVGIGQQDDLVIPGLLEVEFVADVGPDGGDERLDLGVLKNLGQPGFLDVEDLAPDRENGLYPGVASLLGRAGRRIALDDEEL